MLAGKRRDYSHQILLERPRQRPSPEDGPGSQDQRRSQSAVVFVGGRQPQRCSVLITQIERYKIALRQSHNWNETKFRRPHINNGSLDWHLKIDTNAPSDGSGIQNL